MRKSNVFADNYLQLIDCVIIHETILHVIITPAMIKVKKNILRTLVANNCKTRLSNRTETCLWHTHAPIHQIKTVNVYITELKYLKKKREVVFIIWLGYNCFRLDSIHTERQDPAHSKTLNLMFQVCLKIYKEATAHWKRILISLSSWINHRWLRLVYFNYIKYVYLQWFIVVRERLFNVLGYKKAVVMIRTCW